MSDCLFCKIIAGEIPVKIVYEETDLIAIRTSTRRRRCMCSSSRKHTSRR